MPVSDCYRAKDKSVTIIMPGFELYPKLPLSPYCTESLSAFELRKGGFQFSSPAILWIWFSYLSRKGSSNLFLSSHYSSCDSAVAGVLLVGGCKSPKANLDDLFEAGYQECFA